MPARSSRTTTTRRTTTTPTTATGATATAKAPDVFDDAGRPSPEAARVELARYYEEHGPLVERICRALLREPEEAADAAQQVFLSAQRALLGGSRPAEEAAWLATIARNECLRRIQLRMRAPLAVEPEQLDGQGDVHAEAVRRSDVRTLWREIALLPPAQRDAIVLRELAGLSYGELAEALGVTTGAVESLLFRARTSLRRQLRSLAASVNVAGWVSWAGEAASRLFASGATPRGLPVVATSAVAALGAFTLGGDGGARERQIALHARVQATAPVRHVRPATPTAPPVATVEHRSAATPERHERSEAHGEAVAPPVTTALPVEDSGHSGDGDDGSDDRSGESSSDDDSSHSGPG